MYKRLCQPLMLFLFVAMFAACSKKDATGGTNTPPPTGGNGKSVNIQGFAFGPVSLTVAKGTVVMPHDFQTEHARQGRQIDFALVLVTGDDVDRITRALVGTGSVALACRSGATTGRTARSRSAGRSAREGHRRARQAALDGGITAWCRRKSRNIGP